MNSIFYLDNWWRIEKTSHKNVYQLSGNDGQIALIISGIKLKIFIANYYGLKS